MGQINNENKRQPNEQVHSNNGLAGAVQPPLHIVLLSTSSHTGGAAVAARRLRDTLQGYGCQVSLVSLDESGRDREEPIGKNLWSRKMNHFRFYWERLVIFLHNHLNRKELFRVSIANTGCDVSRLPAIQDADIIHLHWINQGFLSLESIRKLAALGKPVVWTMHDMWPITGICHHARECKNYQTECRQCFFLQSNSTDLSTRIFRKKQAIYRDAPLTFVACSDWLARRARSSALMVGKRVISIPNPIDTSVFHPQDKQASRESFSLPADKRLLLFGALNVTDERKGIAYLLEALPLVEAEGVELVVFGHIKEEIRSLVPVPIHAIGYLTDENRIAALYAAVDLFVTSSLEENLPNTLVEAHACGTPCVGFQVGGIPEIILHKQTGYVARYQDATDLAAGISWVLNHPDPEALSAACRARGLHYEGKNFIGQEYISLYRSLLAE